MLRTLLIASALLAASGTSFAHDRDYGRVISVEPRFSVSFGSPYPDGFRVLYESGGYRYWTNTSYYPGPTIVLPPQYRVEPAHRYHGYRRGWDERRGWDDRRDGWRDERRGRRYHHDDDD